MGTSRKNEDNEKGDPLLYHGAKVSVWQRNAFLDDSEGRLHLTVRCYMGADHTVRVIPLPVFGDIAEGALPELFSGTAVLLEEELGDSALAALLRTSSGTCA